MPYFGLFWAITLLIFDEILIWKGYAVRSGKEYILGDFTVRNLGNYSDNRM